MRTLRSAAVLGLVMAVLGCADRLHMGGPAYGRAYQTAIQRQTVNPNAGRSGRAVTHLDSQDAAVIAKTYRKSMSKDEGARDQGMVLITPNQGGGPGGYSLPPPSVPEGR